MRTAGYVKSGAGGEGSAKFRPGNGPDPDNTEEEPFELEVDDEGVFTITPAFPSGGPIEIHREDRQTPVGSLPRVPVPPELLDEVFPLPDGIREQLSSEPDHDEEARVECVYEFLEQDLLPRLRRGNSLTAEELVQLAFRRKTTFRQAHPNDLVGDFPLIDTTDAILLQLQIHFQAARSVNGQWSEEAELVMAAGCHLRTLLEQHFDDLSGI
jgi:hypothetical protein